MRGQMPACEFTGKRCVKETCDGCSVFEIYRKNISCDFTEPNKNSKTNADRIRAMSDEELAVFLEKVADGCDSCPILEECTYTDGEISEEQVRLKWLKQEAET